MMGQGLIARVRGEERGYTLIELLVTIILIGILAAIALAVFLNQADKSKDAAAKSSVNNLVRLVQACHASTNTDDFRDCDTATEIGENSLDIDPTPPDEGAECADTDPGAVGVGQVRVAIADLNCFVVVGTAKSGNKFWYVRRNNATVFRDCTTHGVNGCPTNGVWAG